MDNSTDHREARITAIRQYISLLRQEERRLNLALYSPTSNEFDRATLETDLRRAAQKIDNAEKELRSVEDKLMKRPGR